MLNCIVEDKTIDGLCPFCDQPLGPRRIEWFDGLPVTDAQTLPDLISQLWNGTSHSPRPTNSEGRAVPDHLGELHYMVCTQHQYETMVLPLSVQYQWPRAANYFTLVQAITTDEVINRIKHVFDFPWSGVLINASPPEDASRVQADLEKLVKRPFIKKCG